MWQAGESFVEYYHSKTILANRVPIDDNELVDYIIDGIPDFRLRDQARIQCFNEASDLIKAFEKVTLRSNQRNERGNAKRESQKSKEEAKSVVAEHEKTDLMRRGLGTCFNCKKKGYRAADCNQPRMVPDKKADDRPGKSTETSRSSTEMNLIQPITETTDYRTIYSTCKLFDL